MVERTVCFILDASNWGQGNCCPKTDTLLYSQGEIVFIDRGRGLYAETAESAQSSRNWSCVLTSIILILSTINLQFQCRFVPISLRPVL